MRQYLKLLAMCLAVCGDNQPSFGAGLSQPPGALDSRLRAWRADRHRGPRGRPASFGEARSAVRDRESSRCRRKPRGAGGGERGTRRLHAACHRACSCHQRHTLQAIVLQLHPRHHAGRRSGADAERAGGSSLRASEDRSRVHRLAQGQREQDQLRLGGQRDVGASRNRVVQGDDRYHHAAHSVPRFWSGADRHAVRTSDGAVRHPLVVDRAHPGGQAACDRGDQRQADRRAARRARHCGYRARL